MHKPNYIETYRELLANLRRTYNEDEAMDWIVGGQSIAIGILEQSVLSTLGLGRTDTIIDVGCGSGRLSKRLSSRHDGIFIGTDIIPDLVEYTARTAARKDWQFHVASKPPLPIDSEIADFICFFSVFTHLLDEDIYRYLLEASRILKPGGKIVFSYLDFSVYSHWSIFESTLADQSPNPVLNKFISKDAIHAWAHHLGLKVQCLYDGSEQWIDLQETITYADGRVASGEAEFGQSIGVLTKGQFRSGSPLTLTE